MRLTRTGKLPKNIATVGQLLANDNVHGQLEAVARDDVDQLIVIYTLKNGQIAIKVANVDDPTFNWLLDKAKYIIMTQGWDERTEENES